MSAFSVSPVWYFKVNYSRLRVDEAQCGRIKRGLQDDVGKYGACVTADVNLWWTCLHPPMVGTIASIALMAEG